MSEIILPEVVMAFTGHRPNKLNGEWDMNGPCSHWIAKRIKQQLIEYKVNTVVSGMALGVDQIAAIVAIKNGVSVIAAVPFEGQENRWQQPQKDRFHKILAHPLVKKVVVCEGGYAGPWQMQKRNIWMVDHSTILSAFWNGDTTGGTANCVAYAKKVGRDMIVTDPNNWKL